MRFPTLSEAVAINELVRDPAEVPQSPDDRDDLDRVDRALERARTTSDPIEAAAALAFKIASAQAFFEGNKRTGFLLACWFLDENTESGAEALIPKYDPELGDLLSAAARGEPVRERIVELLRERAVA